MRISRATTRTSRPREALSPWSFGGELRVDAETHVVGAVAVDEREHLAEQRHPGVRHDALTREPGELPQATVERRDLCERETADGIADVWVMRVAGHDRRGVPALNGRDAAVMRHDRAIVGAEPDVQLECRRADLQRVREGFERALRDESEPTPVGLHVELSRRIIGPSFDDGTRR